MERHNERGHSLEVHAEMIVDGVARGARYLVPRAASRTVAIDTSDGISEGRRGDTIGVLGRSRAWAARH